MAVHPSSGGPCIGGKLQWGSSPLGQWAIGDNDPLGGMAEGRGTIGDEAIGNGRTRPRAPAPDSRPCPLLAPLTACRIYSRPGSMAVMSDGDPVRELRGPGLLGGTGFTRGPRGEVPFERASPSPLESNDASGIEGPERRCARDHPHWSPLVDPIGGALARDVRRREKLSPAGHWHGEHGPMALRLPTSPQPRRAHRVRAARVKAIAGVTAAIDALSIANASRSASSRRGPGGLHGLISG